MKRRTRSLCRATNASCAPLSAVYASAVFATPAQAATTVTVNRGVLAIQGDAARNAVVIGRTSSGHITINSTLAVGGAANIADVDLIVADGGPGDDTVRVDETNSTMPATLFIGGVGNDQLSGGSGDDQFTWSPGDGSDFVDGDAGTDTLLFNGSTANEIVNLSSDASHLRLTRDIADVSMTVGGLELAKTDLSRGQDLVQVNDLTGTGTNQLQITLAPPSSKSDASDSVLVAGTSAADRIRISGPSSAGTVTVSGVPVTVLVTVTDALHVHGLAGSDIIDAARLSAGAVHVGRPGQRHPGGHTRRRHSPWGRRQRPARRPGWNRHPRGRDR